MKIAIAGSRGIPNQYGGFEQFAEFLSQELAKNQIDVYVYCPRNHPFKSLNWNNVNRIIKFCPGYPGGAFSQLIYDLLCILDSRKRNFDVIYHLGYTSSSIWFGFHKKSVKIVTNMDGLEWNRNKYNILSRSFLRYAEKKAVNVSDLIVADSKVIKEYLDKKYQINSRYIAYPATIPAKMPLKASALSQIKTEQYNLVICRLQKDNNLETILEGYILSNVPDPLIIIGDHKLKYGRYLRKKYNQKNIIFHGANYDKTQLDAFRSNCGIYFHGHSAGGTNPSLLEAMAAGSLIFAHDNTFNREILGDNALFFKTKNDIATLLPDALLNKENHKAKIENNLEKIKNCFTPDLILQQYIELFVKIKDV